MTPYDVVLVPFPFTDLRATKRRPCLVLAMAEPAGMPVHFIAAMITSQTDRRFPHDVVLGDAKAAGLVKASLVRLLKVVTLDETLVPRRLGRLTAPDQVAVAAALTAMFGSEGG